MLYIIYMHRCPGLIFLSDSVRVGSGQVTVVCMSDVVKIIVVCRSTVSFICDLCCNILCYCKFMSLV